MSFKVKILSLSLKKHAIKSLQFNNDDTKTTSKIDVEAVTASSRDNGPINHSNTFNENVLNDASNNGVLEQSYLSIDIVNGDDENDSILEPPMSISTPIKATNKNASILISLTRQEQTFHANNISMRSLKDDTSYHTNDITMCQDYD